MPKKSGFFRFKKMGKEYLLTNEIGEYIFLTVKEFADFSQDRMNKSSSRYEELARKNFFAEDLETEKFVEKYREKNKHLFQNGPSLHIIVVTLRCNHKCVYCQTSSCSEWEKEKNLSLENARKIVDLIFQSPNRYLAIEFQGGEPLLNWPVVKFITEYAREKNKKEKRNLEIRIVSNLSLLDKKKADYLFKHKVVFCTSLDGPERVHNKNRTWLGGNSQRKTKEWLEYLLKRYKKYYINQPAALLTVTRSSLPYWREIIDEYAKLGLDTIALRPLAPLGVAKKSWQAIGYKPDEFVKFYKKSLDYIFNLNIKKNLFFREALAANIAVKILTERTPNFFELRSPCGAGIGQLLYDYNGDIYTCDEGRMLGKDLFKLGNVENDTYADLILKPAIRTMCLASCLEGLACDDCVYKPYCGTCPIVNYAESGNIFPQLPNSSRCRIYTGIFDYLFQKIRKDDRIKPILLGWISGKSKS
ncbi:MAG: His-Xaa-Ser system radical SAM maturase HxsB [Patescibacteria group bacterium]|nr:His-Xaa-Ser system radical SAM maturase HxsB [Patescibacteria group bacterium]